ncbi:MAG: DEAD/DEAH box helicase family protein [Candidatus Marinimicrobia bacterium]|nr:DEAD/DEAH box helicase family protein [Candidatus Neomarinimicrobiota bacterium]MBT5759212.1 DEAD/DEAH box helicase family protein [Candidatus Neomarinimicrobiota bacterium]MBT6517492.1 DEAD/DEAH box helicase family protein [Candidatus Neomarinimicrobiota bacterium]MBT6711666.1 DEAD/DEAH box helicase family protein [Candidatus Neomarinimicrobiota bacterium]
MDKSKYTEQDICRIFVTPAIQQSGWNSETQIREQVTFTAGKIEVRGNTHKRGKQKRADYILYFKPNIQLAVVEAKDNTHEIGAGMQQALDYAEILDIPFVYTSNGDGFIEHDRTGNSTPIEKEISLSEFPTPGELWTRYKFYKGIETEETEKIISQEYFFDRSGRNPRYYQANAINRTVEAIAKGMNRILLVMATGTGKTYTAFQIIHRLWKSNTKKRILFLADRNILIDQTKRGDFKHFKDKMTVIRKHQIDKSYEIYLALYQGITNYNEDKDAYREFSPDFFDLIVVDECHRGSAAENSAWREILEYFTSATHIGMTATPRETKVISNIDYFGEPVYTYSLKQGIEDGFLAPYKVIRINIDIDSEGWRPEKYKIDKVGEPIEDRLYNMKDYDRTLVIEERTQTVGHRISEYLKATNRFDKTIVFCVDIDHAQRVRQSLINENADLALENSKYVMKITGDDNEGKMELDNFINPEERYPVIATTSKLLTTGVDTQTCKLIVLDSNINSMTEFKQIIGRGTRINEEYGKHFFTIIDFRNVTRLFADPDFDGEPVQIYEPGPDDPPVPPDDPTETGEGEEPTTPDPPIQGDPPIGGEPPEPFKKVYVSGVEVKIINERVQYLDNKGKLITQSLTDYTKTNVKKQFVSLDDFLQKWNEVDKIQTLVNELEDNGVLFNELNETVGKEFDPFDLVCHVAFDQAPLTRKERANNVKKRNYFTKYGNQARAVLETLLDKYSDSGIENIENLNILNIKPFDRFGTPVEILKLFGGRNQFLQAVKELEYEIYKATK